MLLVLLATMPGFLAVLYASIQQFHGAASNVSEEALRAVRVAVRRNDDKIADVVRTLRSILFLGRRQSSDEVCRDLRLFDFRVILADASAKIICRTEENPTKPVSDAGRKALEEAARTGEFAVGDYEIDERSDSSGLSAAYPITLEAEKLFALTDIDLSWFSILAGDLRLPDGSSLIVIDAAGKILAQFPNPRDGMGKPVGEAKRTIFVPFAWLSVLNNTPPCFAALRVAN